MSDSNGPPLDPAAIMAHPPPHAGPRGKVLVSWLVILSVGTAFVVLQSLGKRKQNVEQGDGPGSYVILELQTRVRVGALQTLKIAGKGNVDPAARDAQAQEAAAYNRGSIGQRLRAVIALGEFDSAQRAKNELEALRALIDETGHEPTPAESRLLDILTRLYTDFVDGRPNAPTVNPDERRDVIQSLGWFGELALGPVEADAPNVPNAERSAALAAAQSSFLAITVAGIFVVVAFALGAGGLLLLGIIWYKGFWRSRLGPAVPHQGVYVETFALWFILYIGLILISPWIVGDVLTSSVATCLAMALSLSVLAWPVVRGIPWKQVRRDVGLTLGQQPLLEPILGFVCYFIALPLLAVGFAVMLLNTFLYNLVVQQQQAADPFRPDTTIAHPLIEQLSRGSIVDFLPMFLMACVMAPVMEEIAFRGLLYRHVRDATRLWKFGFLFSAFVVCTLFAIVHPQGVLAVPLLASLAGGFVLAREWRGTLIPAIIAHGLNNALILTFAISCLMR